MSNRRRMREVYNAVIRCMGEPEKAYYTDWRNVTLGNARHLANVSGITDEQDILALYEALSHPELLNRDTDYRTIDDE